MNAPAHPTAPVLAATDSSWDKAHIGTMARRAALGWMVVLVAWWAGLGADAAWGWTGPATVAYSVASVALVVAGWLLAITQHRLVRALGGLGVAGRVGVGVTAVGATLGFVAWAVVVWLTLLGAGALLIGVPMLRRDVLPRRTAALLTYPLPLGAVCVWVAAVSLGEDAAWVLETVILTASLGALVVGLRRLSGCQPASSGWRMPWRRSPSIPAKSRVLHV